MSNDLCHIGTSAAISGLKVVNVAPISSTHSTYNEILTKNNIKQYIFDMFEEMNSKDTAKLLYICLNKLLDKKEQEKLETLLKMCNDYETVVKQIVKI